MVLVPVVDTPQKDIKTLHSNLIKTKRNKKRDLENSFSRIYLSDIETIGSKLLPSPLLRFHMMPKTKKKRACK